MDKREYLALKTCHKPAEARQLFEKEKMTVPSRIVTMRAFVCFIACLTTPLLAVNEGFLIPPEAHLDRALTEAIELKDTHLITYAASTAATVLGKRSYPLLKKATDGLSTCLADPKLFDAAFNLAADCSMVAHILRDRNLELAIKLPQPNGRQAGDPRIFALRKDLYRIIINDHEAEPAASATTAINQLIAKAKRLEVHGDQLPSEFPPENCLIADLMVLSPSHYLACFCNTGSVEVQKEYLTRLSHPFFKPYVYLTELSKRGWATPGDRERLEEFRKMDQIRASRDYTPRIPPFKPQSWEERANWLAGFTFPPLEPPILADLIVFRPKETEELIKTLPAAQQAECRFYAGAGIAATDWEKGLAIMRESKWKPAFIHDDYGEDYIPSVYGTYMLVVSPDKTERVKGRDRQTALEHASRLGFTRTGKLDVMRQIIADLESPEEIDGILCYMTTNLAIHSYGVVVEPLLDEIRDPRRSVDARCSFVECVWRRAIPP